MNTPCGAPTCGLALASCLTSRRTSSSAAPSRRRSQTRSHWLACACTDSSVVPSRMSLRRTSMASCPAPGSPCRVRTAVHGAGAESGEFLCRQISRAARALEDTAVAARLVAAAPGVALAAVVVAAPPPYVFARTAARRRRTSRVRLAVRSSAPNAACLWSVAHESELAIASKGGE